MGSIRRRTLLLVLGLLGIALGGISFLGYRDARHVCAGTAAGF